MHLTLYPLNYISGSNLVAACTIDTVQLWNCIQKGHKQIRNPFSPGALWKVSDEDKGSFIPETMKRKRTVGEEVKREVNRGEGATFAFIARVGGTDKNH